MHQSKLPCHSEECGFLYCIFYTINLFKPSSVHGEVMYQSTFAFLCVCSSFYFELLMYLFLTCSLYISFSASIVLYIWVMRMRKRELNELSDREADNSVQMDVVSSVPSMSSPSSSSVVSNATSDSIAL